ncbi:MAG: hypothetical protein ABI683_00855 [Ginsengibacter sp.]
MGSINNTTPSSSDHYKFFYDEVTKRKIERHLSDINDTISDEDIMNVITDITSDGSNGSVQGLQGISSIPVSNEEEPQQLPTSWNVID